MKEGIPFRIPEVLKSVAPSNTKKPTGRTFPPLALKFTLLLLVLFITSSFLVDIRSAYAALERRVYVPNVGTPTVRIVDATTNAVIGTITLPSSTALAAAAAPDGAHVYILQAEGTVAVIRTVDNQIDRIIDYFPIYPLRLGIAVSPDSRYLYIGEASDSSSGAEIIVVDLTNDAPYFIDSPPSGFYNIGSAPRRFAFSPDGAYVYVADGEDGKIRRFQTADQQDPNPIEELSVAQLPDVAFATDVATLAGGTHALTTVGPSANALRVIHQQTPLTMLSASVPIAIKPEALAVSPNGRYAYVLHYVAGAANNVAPILNDPGDQMVFVTDLTPGTDFQFSAQDDGLPSPPAALSFSYAGSLPFPIVVNAATGEVDIQPRGDIDIGLYPNQSFCASDSAASDCIPVQIEVRAGSG